METGDFDGDGSADFAVAAPGSAVGEVSIFWIMEDCAPQNYSQPDSALRIVATETELLARIELAAADFNSDGFTDLLLGSAWADGYAGAAFVVWGRPVFPDSLDLDTDPLTTRLLRPAGALFFGETVSVTDFFGDGTPDAIVGAWGAVNGSIYLIDDLQLGVQVIDVSTSGYALYDDRQYSAFSLEIATGDIDGDGRGDIVVGAPGQTAATDDGIVYVVFGGAPLTSVTWLSAISEHTTSIVPSEPLTKFGSGLAVCDLNCDGQLEIAIGAPMDDTAGFYDSGAVFILKEPAREEVISTADTARFSVLLGTRDDLAIGSQLASVDANRDMFPDLVINFYSEYYLPQSRDTVRVFAALGKAIDLERANPIITAVSNGNDERFGRSVSCIGDQVAIGAPYANNLSGYIKVFEPSTTAIHNPVVAPKRISLHPNPTGSTFTLSSGYRSRPAKVRIYTVTGKLVHSRNVSEGNAPITFDARSLQLSAGVYFVQFDDKFVREVAKLCVLR